jgi:hypothetical protein
MADRNSNKESKSRLKVAFATIRSKLGLCINLYKYFRHVCFFLILNLYQHLIYLLDLKTVDKVVYQRENSSVLAKVVHDELTKSASVKPNWNPIVGPVRAMPSLTPTPSPLS